MIGHDPHELAAYLSAVLQGYTRQSAQAELERVFDAQYQLTLTEEVEIRYRTETSTDPVTGETTTEEVPYEYYILNVNYFYILIDRANEDKETAVHFLNQVDEADLMALMEDSQTTQEQPATCTCTEKCVAGAVNTACPVCAINMSACTGKEPEPETPEETPEPEEPAQKPAGLNPAILLAVLALMGGGGAFAYFKLVKNKPKTKGNDNLDDYDYGEDDTDQEDEDSWETEESDELDADGGGDEESEDKTV